MSYYWIFRHLRKTILCCLEAYRPTTDWRTESSSTSLRNLKTRTYLGCLSTEYKENIWTQEEEKTRGWKNDIMRSFIICPSPPPRDDNATKWSSALWTGCVALSETCKTQNLGCKKCRQENIFIFTPRLEAELKMNFQGTGWDFLVWIHVALYRNQ